ncbi:MAG: glucose 1-dehydrogenase [Candidatus Poribacteria bacterium]|nr:glucose 1-dehydrogenase [Candidatus Poribacteria bacterium]
MLLKDRVCIVTGGSSGIGRGIALEFAREGARVAVVDERETPLRGKYHETDVTTPTVAEIEKLGAQGTFLQTDVADEAQVADAIQQTVARFGGLDILVNNAGIHIPGGAQEISIADWDKVVGVNLRGVFVATKLAIPHLKQSKFGRIIQIASVHAYGGGAGPAYAPAKAAVVNMVRDTALEIGEFGITVNAICPGYIETAIQDYLTPEQIEEALEKTALPRFGLPRDIGRACVFLASDDAEWVTGASLLVDGGFAAGV